MYSVAARSLNRLFVAAPALFLGLIQVGSAQLVTTPYYLTGYARDTDRALPSYKTGVGFADGGTVGGVLSAVLPEAPSTLTSSDPVSPPSLVSSPSLVAPHSLPTLEDFRELPAETDDVPRPHTAGVTFDGINLEAASAVLHHGLMRRSQHPNNQTAADPDDGDFRVKEGYHWSGLIAQSLFFNVIENGFRVASDDQIRTLLATKPFWHDYVASMNQFNMGRWNDGDDFLVNYVGHPMQGAVSGFIEIQNDPTGREQEISATRAYWMSRFKAFLWATAYSTHSEISPIGEAGIGNEGGWTYPLNCPKPCTQSGVHTKYTNNTGWVDFIITPTVGSLWMVAEDTLDRYVSDRVQGENRSRFLPKILRGTLNPSRTMANALRLKAPWYRDFQHGRDLESSYGVHFLRSDESRAAERFRRFAVMPYFIAMPLGTAAHPCTFCMQSPGAGVQADVALMRWMAVSFAVSKQQGAMQQGSAANGSTTSTGLGVRLIHDRPNNTISLALRAGTLTEHVPLPQNVDASHQTYSGPSESQVTHATTTIMLSNDYKLSRRIAFRSSFGTTIIRYRNPVPTPPGIGTPPHLSWLSHDTFTNTPTWTCEMGPVVHF
jgi:hypothetical protein